MKPTFLFLTAVAFLTSNVSSKIQEDADEDMDMEMIEEETIVHSLHAYPPYSQSYHNQPYSPVHNQVAAISPTSVPYVNHSPPGPYSPTHYLYNPVYQSTYEDPNIYHAAKVLSETEYRSPLFQHHKKYKEPAIHFEPLAPKVQNLAAPYSNEVHNLAAPHINQVHHTVFDVHPAVHPPHDVYLAVHPPHHDVHPAVHHPHHDVHPAVHPHNNVVHNVHPTAHPHLNEVHTITPQPVFSVDPGILRKGLHHNSQPQYRYSHLQDYIPYQYDPLKLPECAYSKTNYYNISFCLQDDYYPVDTIKHELARNRPLVDRLMSDLGQQSADNLVDGVSKYEEESYTYKHYYGDQQHQKFGKDFHGYHYSHEYYDQGGGYICPSDIFYGRLKRGLNIHGKWKVIVNLPDEFYSKGEGKGYEHYTQTSRLEQCMYPDAPCSFIQSTIHSSCRQKYNFVRLLSYSYEQGLHIDSFRLPVACSCHVKPPLYMYTHQHQVPHYTPTLPTPVPYIPHHTPTPYVTGKKK